MTTVFTTKFNASDVRKNVQIILNTFPFTYLMSDALNFVVNTVMCYYCVTTVFNMKFNASDVT